MAPRTRRPTEKAATTKDPITATKKTTTTKKKTTKPQATTRKSAPSSDKNPPPDDDETSLTPDNLKDVVNTLTKNVESLNVNASETHDSIEQLREGMTHIDAKMDETINSITDRIDALAALFSGTNSPTQLNKPADTINGTNPQTFLQTHLPWVDQSTLTSLVAGKLEVKDLLRLIPAEDRPRGRTTAIPGVVSFDNQTGKWIQSDDMPNTFDKDFPDLNTALHTLSVYGAIRSLFDADNVGIAPAIFLYIKQLTRWVLVDRFSWHHIRSYFIAHFRKYQASTDPLSWIEIDPQLFIAHIRPPTGSVHASSSTGRGPPGPPGSNGKNLKKDAVVCNNWNTQGKGCTWNLCARLHQCSTCSSNDHPSYKCKTKQEPKA
jgi:hypothetical protein